MSQALVIYNYKNKRSSLSCTTFEKMINICERIASKIQEDLNKLDFIYNGALINRDLKFEEQVNEIDKIDYNMNLIVVNKREYEEIICPECNENLLIKLKDYRININKCRNSHDSDKDELTFEDFLNYQQKDTLKKNCDICNNNTNDLYKCITWNNNLCLSCKENHDNNHKIINYEKRNLICYKHNDFYTKYCHDCNKNICINCEKEHNNHNAIY